MDYSSQIHNMYCFFSVITGHMMYIDVLIRVVVLATLCHAFGDWRFRQPHVKPVTTKAPDLTHLLVPSYFENDVCRASPGKSINSFLINLTY